MSWILPTLDALPTGGKVRSVGAFDKRAYHRAYYHAKRKGKPQKPATAEQLAKRAAAQRRRYYANLERFRANARANYWRHRDKYAAAARERARAKRKQPT
jgi:hypothetical protein